MYVKNNDFYFSKNDYLHFNKLKFTVRDFNTCRIVSKNHYDYKMNISLHIDYGIYINFGKTLIPNEKLKLFITKDKHRNKMSLLYNLKWAVSSLYNALSLCKQYVYVFKFSNTLNLVIKPASKIYNNVNLIVLRERHIGLYIDINNPIKQNNTITVIMRPDINNLLFNKISVESNIIYTRHMSIIHPESYNIIYYKGMKLDSIRFEYNDDYYIKKLCETYYISYCTPPPLLAKFIDNIKLFDNIDKVHINNEYDILKYM